MSGNHPHSTKTSGRKLNLLLALLVLVSAGLIWLALAGCDEAAAHSQPAASLTSSQV
jgi:hypothetical protein